MSRKVVIVEYAYNDAFIIPENINLEDKTQVKWWGVKWNVLHIVFTNGKELEVESQGWTDNMDLSRPVKEPVIEEAEDWYCIDTEDDGFKEVEI